jgi:fumarylacetoacetate (FAA) hydrolase
VSLTCLPRYTTGVASKLQQCWTTGRFMAPQLQDLYELLNGGKARHAFTV